MQRKNIKFLRLNYKIPESASSTGRTATGDFVLEWCGYADDLVLSFDDEKSLQKGIAILDEVFTRYRLSINTSKTKSMILNQQYQEQEYPTSIASLRGEKLENIKSYKYLGCEIKYDEPTTGTTELNMRSDAAEGKFYALAKKLFNMQIKLKTRTRMLNSLVRSRIIYSCQTWSCTKAQLSKMNSLYMSFIRKITKGGYRRKEDSMAYVYSNEDLLKIAQTTDLNTFIKQQQRNYVCHIVRKDNSSIVKRLLFNNNTATKRGPQTTVLSEVLKSEKCTPSELFRSAMQRKH